MCANVIATQSLMRSRSRTTVNLFVPLLFKVNNLSVSAIVSKDVTCEPTLTLPKPFLDEGLLNSKLPRLSDTVKENVFRHPTFIDEDAESWAHKQPYPAPLDPYVLPFPLRIGVAQRHCVAPDKFANLELMKIQNFLHLTPPTIKLQCEALKEFCTPFPAELDSDEACEREFPVEIHTVDYIAAAKTPRNSKARCVEKKIRLCNMVLDSHARLKIIKLLGKVRYNRNSDFLSIKADRCPFRRQNMDYIDYVLTALYFESWKRERWESREYVDGSDDDHYWWEDSVSQANLQRILDARPDPVSSSPPATGSTQKWRGEDGGRLDEAVGKYRRAVTAIKLEPAPDRLRQMDAQREALIDQYRDSVLDLLDFNQQPAVAAV